MALPTPLTADQVGGAAASTQTKVSFRTGPNAGTTLLVSKTDPNLQSSINDGSVVGDSTLKFPPPAPPVNTTPPEITGSPVVGQVLNVTNGVWTNSPTFARQWLRAGNPISGATGATYTLAAGDSGQLISCRVTATNADGQATALSNVVGPVNAA